MWYFYIVINICYLAMEDKEKDKMDVLFRQRSYMSCLAEGMKLPTRNFLPLLRFLYPSLLFLVAVSGVAGLLSGQMALAGALRSIGGAGNTFLIVQIVFCALWFLGMAFYWGQIMFAIRHYNVTGTLEGLSFRRNLRPLGTLWARAFVLLIIATALLLVVSVATVFGQPVIGVWGLVMMVVFVLAVMVPYVAVCQEGLLFQERPLVRCFRSFRLGFRYWSGFFIVSLCSALLAGILLFVVLLPSFVLTYAVSLSVTAVLNGDAAEMPSYTIGLLAFFYMLSTLLMLIISWIKFFPLSFLYGSVVSREVEMVAYENSQENADV